MKTMKLVQLVVLILFSTMLLNAQPEKNRRIHDELNLTDQQKEQIEDLRTDHQKRMIDLRANVQKNQADLRSLERKGNYSRNDYLAAIDKVTKAKNELARERAVHRMDVYEKLNDDQKKIFNERPMGKRDGKGKHMRGRGMGDNGGGCQFMK